MRARICSMICSTLSESERMLKSGIKQVFTPSERERPVDYQHEDGSPERHAREQRSIRDKQLRRAPAALALVNQIQISKNPVQGEWNRHPQPRRAELLFSLRADRVEHVRQERRARDDRNHLIEQIGTVLAEDLAVARRAAGEEHEFVPPLRQRDEQGHQDRAYEQPVADLDANGYGAGHGAQHESDRNRQDRKSTRLNSSHANT